MEQSDWSAHWITNEQYVTGKNALPVFSKDFEATCAPKRARLYFIGLGVQWAAINGEDVTNEVLLPSYTTMNTTLFYSSYDVTNHIHRGENTIVVELGKGVYDAEKGLDGRYTKFIAAGSPLHLKLLAQLEYDCGDGHSAFVASDGTWQTTTAGPFLESSWYGGEEYDARRDLSHQYRANGKRSSWDKANVTMAPYPDLQPKLVSLEMPPLKITEDFPCLSVTQTNVSYVFDFGQNFAGWYRFNLRGERDHRITIWPGELLLSNGSVSQATTGAPIFDGYTFAGDDVETYSPKFMYHGFRYLEVFGLLHPPGKDDIIGHRIRFDAPSTGQLEVSIPLFNKIHGIIDQATQNQMYTVFTDCPHREKLGWLDQDNLAIAPALFSYDFRAFGRHMMKQMRDSQNSAGEVPTTAPQLTEFGSWPPYGDGFDQAPNWGASIVLFAWDHYVAYGDVGVLQDSYQGMKSYVNYLSRMNETSHILWSGLGDWEAIDSTTPFGVTGTSAYARCVKAMTLIARVLGHASDAATYANLHEQILSAFQSTFFNKTKSAVTYASGSQACDAIALHIGAVPPKYQDTVCEHLEESIRHNGTHVTVGEVGLPALIDALTSAGKQDLLYDMFRSTTYPSYGFLVEQGATTMTEYWNGPLGTGSQDHVIFAGGDVWLSGLAGMKQSEGSVGWQAIDYDPVIVGDLKAAKVEFQSVKGLAAASWTLNNNALTYRVTVPVGSQGTVYMPGSTYSVQLDGKKIRRQVGVRGMEERGQKAVISIGSGTYTFTSKLYID